MIIGFRAKPDKDVVFVSPRAHKHLEKIQKRGKKLFVKYFDDL